MRAQLDRLILALGMSNLEFGIILPGTVLPVAPMAGFLIADDVTVVETFTSADTLRGEESAKYAEFADGLMAQAITGDDARDLVTAAARDLPLRPGVALRSRALSQPELVSRPGWSTAIPARSRASRAADTPGRCFCSIPKICYIGLRTYEQRRCRGYARPSAGC